MTGIDVFLSVMLIIGFLGMIFTGIIYAKNEITYRNRIRIIDAISLYMKYMINMGASLDGVPVQFDDMEDYDRTLFRLWDWGCTRILPFDKYMIIESFVEPYREER